jgi:hypothetical protein
MRGCGVGPFITKRFEACAFASNCCEDIEQVTRRSRKAVKSCHNKRIALCQGAIAFFNCVRSLVAPLTFSLNTLAAPAALSWAT